MTADEVRGDTLLVSGVGQLKPSGRGGGDQLIIHLETLPMSEHPLELAASKR